MNFSTLADQPKYADQVARWYFDEWASKFVGVTYEQVRQKITTNTSNIHAPMIILATEHGKLIGAAELKIQEMADYPEYKYWLAGVYVDISYRKSGVGLQLINEAVSRAIISGIETLYLQTINLGGGIYRDAGFEPLMKANNNGYDILIMKADLNCLDTVS